MTSCLNVHFPQPLNNHFFDLINKQIVSTLLQLFLMSDGRHCLHHSSILPVFTVVLDGR